VKRLLVPFVAVVVLVACAPVFALFDTPFDDPPASPETMTEQQITDIAAPPPATLIAAGDIAGCDSNGDEATAKLLETLVRQNKDAVIAPLGDNVYPSGTLMRYRDCYGPTWGQFMDRTRSAQGNHDFADGTGEAYYAYFGEAAGPKNKGYYSYALGAWHVVVLNSNCWAVGGCGAGSPQLEWLRRDLKSSPAKCTLAYWHHPRFSSGLHGDAEEMTAVWGALQDAGADLVLSGHDHHYERFAPHGHRR
jgi:acid phosphatase type 7